MQSVELPRFQACTLLLPGLHLSRILIGIFVVASIDTALPSLENAGLQSDKNDVVDRVGDAMLSRFLQSRRVLPQWAGGAVRLPAGHVYSLAWAGGEHYAGENQGPSVILKDSEYQPAGD